MSELNKTLNKNFLMDFPIVKISCLIKRIFPFYITRMGRLDKKLISVYSNYNYMHVYFRIIILYFEREILYVCSMLYNF